jgi:hypothetical protein
LDWNGLKYTLISEEHQGTNKTHDGEISMLPKWLLLLNLHFEMQVNLYIHKKKPEGLVSMAFFEIRAIKTFTRGSS